jgi:hypothetical protein
MDAMNNSRNGKNRKAFSQPCKNQEKLVQKSSGQGRGQDAPNKNRQRFEKSRGKAKNEKKQK